MAAITNEDTGKPFESFIDEDTYQNACAIDKQIADEIKTTMDNKERLHMELEKKILEDAFKRVANEMTGGMAKISINF